jgi:hypothetical protein
VVNGEMSLRRLKLSIDEVVTPREEEEEEEEEEQQQQQQQQQQEVSLHSLVETVDD